MIKEDINFKQQNLQWLTNQLQKQLSILINKEQ